MSEKRPPFVAITGPYTWQHGLEYWRLGRPDMIAMLIADTEQEIPAEHRVEIARLIANPPAMVKPPVRAILEHEAAEMRALYARRKQVFAQDGRGSAAKRAFQSMCDGFPGIPEGTLRDILERKHAYAPRGEQKQKPPHKKRVHHKKSV